MSIGVAIMLNERKLLTSLLVECGGVICAIITLVLNLVKAFSFDGPNCIVKFSNNILDRCMEIYHVRGIDNDIQYLLPRRYASSFYKSDSW